MEKQTMDRICGSSLVSLFFLLTMTQNEMCCVCTESSNLITRTERAPRRYGYVVCGEWKHVREQQREGSNTTQHSRRPLTKRPQQLLCAEIKETNMCALNFFFQNNFYSHSTDRHHAVAAHARHWWFDSVNIGRWCAGSHSIMIVIEESISCSQRSVPMSNNTENYQLLSLCLSVSRLVIANVLSTHSNALCALFSISISNNSHSFVPPLS